MGSLMKLQILKKTAHGAPFGCRFKMVVVFSLVRAAITCLDESLPVFLCTVSCQYLFHRS